MHRGYIKIWRKTEDSGLLQLPETLALFMLLLSKATHKPVRIGSTILERGQWSSGRIELARILKQSEQQVRTGLKRLEKLEIITIESTSFGSVYTIVNYSTYQDVDAAINQPINQQSTSDQPTTNQQSTSDQPHNKHINTQAHKHISTETQKQKPAAECSAEFELAWDAYPKRSGASKKDAYKAWQSRVKAGADIQAMIDGAARYAIFCRVSGTEDRFIKQASTFFGPGDHYLADWTPQAQSAKNGTRMPASDNFATKDYGTGVNPL